MDIERILQTGETQSVEFKKSLSQMKEGCKALCGMLNTEVGAGMVLFGISPENEVVGIEGNLDSAQRSLAQHIQQKFDLSIKVSIQIEEYEGKKILILSAKRSNDVRYYEYDGRAFIKEGSTKRCLSIQEKESLNNSRFDKINILEISEKELEEKLFEIFKQRNSFIETRFLKNIFAQIFSTLKEERKNFSDKSLLIENLNKVFIPYLDRIFIIWEISNDYDAFDFAERMIDFLHKLYVDVFVDLDFAKLKGIFDVFWIQSKIIFIVYCMGAYSILKDKPNFAKLLINRTNPFRPDRFKNLSWFKYILTRLARSGELKNESLCFNAFEFIKTNKYLLDYFNGEEKLKDYLGQFDFLQCANTLVKQILENREIEVSECYPSFGAFFKERIEPIVEKIIKTYIENEWLPEINKPNIKKIIVELDRFADKKFGFFGPWDFGDWNSKIINNLLQQDKKD